MGLFKKKKYTPQEKKRIEERNEKIRDFTAGLAEKMQLAEKWQKAQSWSEKNKILTVVIVYIVMISLGVLTYYTNFKTSEKSKLQEERVALIMKDGTDMVDIISNMQKIRQQNAEVKETFGLVAKSAAQLKKEIDSLQAIPNKTPQDSVLLKIKILEARKLLYNK